jgi:hypothetical protein
LLFSASSSSSTRAEEVAASAAATSSCPSQTVLGEPFSVPAALRAGSWDASERSARRRPARPTCLEGVAQIARLAVTSSSTSRCARLTTVTTKLPPGRAMQDASSRGLFGEFPGEDARFLQTVYSTYLLWSRVVTILTAWPIP